MKKVLISFLLAQIAFLASAEEINALLLLLSSHKQVVCLLEEQPTISFQEDKLIITTTQNELSYEADDVQKFTYSYVDTSDISQVENSKYLISIKGNELSVSGFESDTPIYIYTSDGSLVAKSITYSGEATFTLPEGSNSTYIVKTPIVNFKIMKP